MGSKLEQSAQTMSYSEAKTILRNNFRTEWQQRLDTGTEVDSILQLDRAAQVTIFRLRTGHCQPLSSLHRLKISHSDECPCGTGPQTPNHILPHLRWIETPDMAQFGGSPQEALGTGRDTAADFGLRLTHRTENLAWLGTQKKKKTNDVTSDTQHVVAPAIKVTRNLKYEVHRTDRWALDRWVDKATSL